MFSLQFEVENAALRETNKHQAAQMEELRKQVQGEGFFSITDRGDVGHAHTF